MKDTIETPAWTPAPAPQSNTDYRRQREYHNTVNDLKATSELTATTMNEEVEA